MYNFAPELEGDMKVSLENAHEAEHLLGTWDMLQLESDPICNSAGCT